jgi:hypothetical protein
MNAGATRCGKPVLAVSGAQKAGVITEGRIDSLEGLPPDDGAGSGVDSTNDADIAERIQEAGLFVSPRLVKKGPVGLRDANETVMEVNVADLVAEDGAGERGGGKEQ